jgi:RNA polymerase-binding transcription factor DksA
VSSNNPSASAGFKAKKAPTVAHASYRASPMKPDDLTNFQEMLRMLQARIRGDVEQIQDEALSGSGNGNDDRSSNHMAEMGSDAWDLDFSLQLVENDQEVLGEISVALKKIESGRFGLCECCLEQGKPDTRSRIPKMRLKAIPYARNCVDCERELEGQR